MFAVPLRVRHFFLEIHAQIILLIQKLPGEKPGRMDFICRA